MIKITKGDCPRILQENATSWTQTLLTKLASGEEPTATERSRYNHPEVKEALVKETYGKCAYCESKVRHVAPGDIEHITPKSVRPEFWYEWSNLTLACPVCNRNKGVRDEGLVDPYEVDPEEFLHFAGAFVFGRPGNDSGKLTERVLDLNRAALVERRLERLNAIFSLLDVIKRTSSPQVRAILEHDFLEEVRDDKEYSAMAREALRCARARGDFPT